MNRSTALVAIIILWAVIYLPWLGTPELKGEEGRRILPALAMLDTGDWLVPHLNGKPYLRKPPLVNWAIARSMELTGSRDEWAARLPSAVTMLLLALAMVWTGSRWLTPAGGFTAAVFVLASVAFVEKGRLAEIEAIYVGLTGIAFAWWLAAWAMKETGWRLWLVPEIFLGLGLLAKGPTHMFFFYGIIIPILFADKNLRQLWSRAHLVSLALAFCLFFAWAIPYFHATANATGVWVDQMKGRVGGGSLHLADWLPNLPRALCNGLPWILFAPLWWNTRVLNALDERKRLLVKAARWPLVIGFAGLMLIPGMLPRYTLPFWPAGALLLALVAQHAAPVWRNIWLWTNRFLFTVIIAGMFIGKYVVRPVVLSHESMEILVGLSVVSFILLILTWKCPPKESDDVSKLATGSALAVAGGLAFFSVAVLPRLTLRDEFRPVGTAINAVVPQNTTLYVVDLGYEPSLFYVSRSLSFVPSREVIPQNAGYVLVRAEDVDYVKKHWPQAADTVDMGRKTKKQFFVLKLSR